jgi:hypothetical protein
MDTIRSAKRRSRSDIICESICTWLRITRISICSEFLKESSAPSLLVCLSNGALLIFYEYHRALMSTSFPVPVFNAGLGISSKISDQIIVIASVFPYLCKVERPEGRCINP